jgi:hypothetical protein
MFNSQIDHLEHLQMVSPSYLGGYFTNLSKKVGRLSGYNTKAKEHFQYTASGYKFEGDYKAFQEELER